jgi:hypothetical protein
MKLASAHISDLRGTLVWSGIAFALLAFLAQEWPVGDLNFGPLMFFGGLLLGLGLMQNRCRRGVEQQQHGDAD